MRKHVDEIDPRGEFHQPYGPKRKCAGSQSFAPAVSLLPLSVSPANLRPTLPVDWYTQLEVTPNFYAVCSVPYASKFIVNLLTQKLLIQWWWNRPWQMEQEKMRNVFDINKSKVLISLDKLAITTTRRTTALVYVSLFDIG